jgi:hypothetical protein
LGCDVPNEKKPGACSTPGFTTSQKQRGLAGEAGEFAAHTTSAGALKKKPGSTGFSERDWIGLTATLQSKL